MSIEQKLKVQDELQIITSYIAGKSIGKLTFVLPDTTNTVFGQIRSIGSYPYGALLIDCSGMSSGINFKTDSTQGYSDFGGIGNPFSASITSYTIYSGSVRLSQPPYVLSTSGTQILNESGYEMLFCTRNGTSGSTDKDFNIIKAVQNNFKIGETMSITVGSDAYNAYRTVLGFSTPSGYPTGDCVGFVGLQKDGFPDVNTKSLVWDINGNVNVPFALSVTGTTSITGNLVCQNDLQSNSATITTTLTADTLSATTYVGLPAFDPAVLDPITLDTVNDRVGINQVTPTEALDVTGNIKSSGTITGDTVSATTYVGLPAFDPAVLDPITLDTVNDRVGINQVTPTEALDVTGNIKSSGTITGDTVSATTYVGLPAFDPAVLDPITLDTVNDRVGINQVTPTEALDVTGNIKSSGTITGNTVSATTYIGLPSSSVLPITLDTVNNRVGINKTSPSVTLDVDGSCFISGATTIDDTFVVQNSSPFSTLGMTCNPTTGMTNVVDLSATGTVSAGTVSATTYVGLPAFDPAVLDPITLNSTFNRVGINQASPGFNLDINGDCYIDQDLRVGTMVNVNGAYVNSGNGTPESIVAAPVGSMYMRRDGASGTTLYTKVTGTGATGWTAISGGSSGIGTIVSNKKTTSTVLTSSVSNITNITLTAGTWIIFCYSSSSNDYSHRCGITTSSTTFPTFDPVDSGTGYFQLIGNGSNSIIVTLTVSTVYYFLAKLGTTTSVTLAANSGLKAIRIA